MSRNEQKEWLRAILEGRIKPGDAEWRKIWSGEDFEGVREVLRNVGIHDGMEWMPDEKKMWREIDRWCRQDSEQENTGRQGRDRRRKRLPGWMRVAAVVLPMAVAGSLWWAIQRNQPEVLPGDAPLIEAGGPQAMLLLSNGEKIYLSAMSSDTILSEKNVHIRIDSAQMVKYEMTEAAVEIPEYNTIVVPRRGEYQLVLADGSKVYLNSESELRYPTHFVGKERRVYLRGEGYFKVARDTAHPFIVTAGNTDVNVLGTSFNVQAYDTDKLIRTTLVNGKVEVCDRTTQERQLLRPGQQAAWRPGEPIAVAEVNVENYVSWVNGKFYFSGSTLEEISEQMQRWYDLEFFFMSEELKHYAFVGVINKEYSANKVFSMIEKTTHVKFELKGRTVIVRNAER